MRRVSTRSSTRANENNVQSYINLKNRNLIGNTFGSNITNLATDHLKKATKVFIFNINLYHCFYIFFYSRQLNHPKLQHLVDLNQRRYIFYTLY